jgi:competence protein ComEC
MLKTILKLFTRKAFDMLIVDFINVGYGDAVLIREKKNGVSIFSALIDCGDADVGANPLNNRIHAANFLVKEGISHLSLLIITHLHLDHSGGLERIADEVKISEFCSSYIPDESIWGNTFSAPETAGIDTVRLIRSANIYSKALHSMYLAGTNYRLLDKKVEFKIGNTNFNISVPEPTLLLRQKEILDKFYKGEGSIQEVDELHGMINNIGICIRLEYAGRSFEVTGDTSAANYRFSSPCTVFKIPHHGHSDSMTPDLAHALKADYAVLSVSDNRKDNCPDAEIVKILSECGTKVLATYNCKAGSSVQFIVNESGGVSCNIRESTSMPVPAPDL